MRRGPWRMVPVIPHQLQLSARYNKHQGTLATNINMLELVHDVYLLSQSHWKLLWCKVSITDNMGQRTVEIRAAAEKIPTSIITSAPRLGFILFPLFSILTSIFQTAIRQNLSICLQRRRETECARNEMGTDRTIPPFSNTTYPCICTIVVP